MLFFQKVVALNTKVTAFSLVTAVILLINNTGACQDITRLSDSYQNEVFDTTPKLYTIKSVKVLQPTLADTPKTNPLLAVSVKEAKPLTGNIYQKFQKPDTAVRFQVIKNGKVLRTETAKLENIQVPLNEKIIIPYKKQISPVDEVTYRRLRSISPVSFSKTDVKVIPELHIENKDSSQKATSYELYFFPYQSFLFNDSLKKFVAKIGFFFLGHDSSSPNLNTFEPVTVVVASRDAPLIKPRPLEISHLNFPASDVDLMGEHLSDSAEINVITVSNPDGYRTFLSVKPALEISSNRISLQGYGIQKIPVEVRLIGSKSSDSVKVNLSVGKGTVIPNSVMVSYNSPQTVYVTSEGIGDTKLSAKSSNLESNDLQFTYVFPWIFLLASVFGGLVGGFAKYYSGSGAKQFSFKPIIGGTLIGLVGAAAYYALGINLLGLRITAELNEFAVFGLSALCAYFGITKGGPAV